MAEMGRKPWCLGRWTSGTWGLRPLAWAEAPGVDPRGWVLFLVVLAGLLEVPRTSVALQGGAVRGPSDPPPSGSWGAVALMTGKCCWGRGPGARMAQEGAQGCDNPPPPVPVLAPTSISSSHDGNTEGFHGAGGWWGTKSLHPHPSPFPGFTWANSWSDGRGLLGPQPAPQEVELRTSKSGVGDAWGRDSQEAQGLSG